MPTPTWFRQHGRFVERKHNNGEEKERTVPLGRLRKWFEGAVFESTQTRLSVSTFELRAHLFGERVRRSPLKASTSAALSRVPASAEYRAFVLPLDRCRAIEPSNKEPQTPDLTRILSFTRILHGVWGFPCQATVDGRKFPVEYNGGSPALTQLFSRKWVM